MKAIKKLKNPPKNKNRIIFTPSLTFLDHLLELRSRILVCLISCIVFSVAGYLIRDSLINILLKPFGGILYYLSPTGGFDFVISVCLVFGSLVSIPIIFYESIKYILPAFPNQSKRFIVSVILGSFFLMTLGVVFAYFISLPLVLSFLQKFGNASLQSLISADLFLSFLLRYIFGFGLLFELPLIVLVINKIYPLPFKILFSFERWIILLSTIFAAVITPTSDILNMAVMAIPMIFLYQVSIVLVLVINKKLLNKKI